MKRRVVGQLIYPAGALVALVQAASAPAEECAYAVSHERDRIAVIDVATTQLRGFISVGSGVRPYAVAIAPDGRHAYLANRSADTVSVVDTAEQAVVAAIPIERPFNVTVTPDGGTLWVTDVDSSGGMGTVSVVDTATQRVTGTIPATARGLAFSPDARFAYILGVEPGATEGALLVVDTATKEVVKRIPVDGGLIAVSPDGAFAYVTTAFSLLVVDLAAGSVVEQISLPLRDYAADMTLTPDGAFVYIAVVGGAGLLIVDTAARRLVATVPSFQVERVAASADGRFVYTIAVIPGEADFYIQMIDTTTHQVSAIIPQRGNDLAVTPDGSFLYVVNGGALLIVDTTTHAVVAQIDGTFPRFDVASAANGMLYLTTGTQKVLEVNPVTGSFDVLASLPLYPRRLALSPDGRTAYVTTWTYGQPGQVTAVDTTLRTVKASLEVEQPEAVAVSPIEAKVYVADHALAGGVVVVDSTTHTVSGRIPAPFTADVVFSPDGARAYALRTGAGAELAIIDTASNSLRTALALPLRGFERVERSAGIVVAPDGHRVYIAAAVAFGHPGGSGASEPTEWFESRSHCCNIVFGRLFIADLEEQTVAVAPFGTLGTLSGAALTADGTALYLTHNDVATVIDTRTLGVVATVTLGSDVSGIAIGRGPPGCAAAGIRPILASDCNDDGAVAVDDVLTLVRVALEQSSLSICPAGDADRNGTVTVDEIVAAVRIALQ